MIPAADTNDDVNDEGRTEKRLARRKRCTQTSADVDIAIELYATGDVRFWMSGLQTGRGRGVNSSGSYGDGNDLNHAHEGDEALVVTC